MPGLPRIFTSARCCQVPNLWTGLPSQLHIASGNLFYLQLIRLFFVFFYYTDQTGNSLNSFTQLAVESRVFATSTQSFVLWLIQQMALLLQRLCSIQEFPFMNSFLSNLFVHLLIHCGCCCCCDCYRDARSNLIMIELMEEERQNAKPNWYSFFLLQIKWLPLHATHFRWSIIIMHANVYDMQNIVTIKYIVMCACVFFFCALNLFAFCNEFTFFARKSIKVLGTDDCLC